MFGRKNEETPEEVSHVPLRKGQTAKKGAPTPKRKDAQRQNYRPIVADHTKLTKEEKKARRKEARAREDEAWRLSQEAMRTGDERHMPAQHAGPIRRFARDYLDARITLGSGFMPLALLLILSLFVQSINPTAFTIVVAVIYVLFIVMLLDSWWAIRNAKILIEHKFGAGKVPARFGWTMLSRTFYPRRWRLPVPMVKRGEYPAGGSPADLKEARRARKGK